MAHRTVLVTGASGFIAAHIVRELLERGYRVRGSVRGNLSEPRYDTLRELRGARERLTLHAADLSDEEPWGRLAEGCVGVVHAASPYRLEASDPQREIIDPAVVGTRHVVGAALRVGVPRVVFTSSLAAVTDEPVSGVVFTEDDWNERSSVTRNPYYASKAAAERAAWEAAGEAPEDASVVSINPGVVWGPSLTSGLNTSAAVLRDMLSGASPALAAIDWPLVDVRDVALAHVAALELRSASGRYICVNQSLSMDEVARKLRSSGLAQGHRLTRLHLRGRVGNWLARAYARTRPPGLRSYLMTHIGREFEVDGSRLTRELGVGYRGVDETIRDTVADLERWGHLRRSA